jgi:hypothetical protein
MDSGLSQSLHWQSDAVIPRQDVKFKLTLFCHLIDNILEAFEPLAMLEGEVVVEVLADVGDDHVGEWQHLRAVHHSIAPGRVTDTVTIHYFKKETKYL